jgi:RNA polymerase sigma-70 factor (ECF subfamily)
MPDGDILRPAGPDSAYSSIETMATASMTEANREAAPEMTFAEVLRANQSMVFSLAYHFLRDRAAAEEIAQDVFLQLYRKMDDLEGAKHVTFWLRKVTSHRCIDYVRKRGSQSTISLEDVAEPSIPEQHGDPLLNRRLRQLIAALPEKPRIVMVLRYQEDLTPEEISEVLEMPLGTVKSHLQRSLGMLREKIDRSMGDIR